MEAACRRQLEAFGFAVDRPPAHAYGSAAVRLAAHRVGSTLEAGVAAGRRFSREGG